MRTGAGDCPPRAALTCGRWHAEDYGVSVRPFQKRFCTFMENCVAVSKLDLSSMRIVSMYIAQSVALDHIERRVDRMLEKWTEMNSSVASTGKLDTPSSELFKLVAASNQVMANMATRLNLLDRWERARAVCAAPSRTHAADSVRYSTRPGEAAWNFERYYGLVKGLQDEFMLDMRVTSLKEKMDIMKDSVTYGGRLLACNGGRPPRVQVLLGDCVQPQEHALGVDHHFAHHRRAGHLCG